MFKTKQKMPPYHTKIKQWIQFQPININTSPQSLLVFVVPFSFTHQKKKKKEMQNGQNSDSSPSPLIDTTNAHNLENQTTITRTKRMHPRSFTNQHYKKTLKTEEQIGQYQTLETVQPHLPRCSYHWTQNHLMAAMFASKWPTECLTKLKVVSLLLKKMMMAFGHDLNQQM